ncbi:hypothetical protein BXZ70DRAFT_1003383 [Cristinia sonorae]|uniref:Plasma membrane fusion protein PRM1 n=1 Tax=Cristinia sonorae TaxID=1940300 RepID=A0A8K0UZV5_9AGAR|nr:hypothetical protein BXZ70DRAFT_1003383 [Cristinia sonorae]
MSSQNRWMSPPPVYDAAHSAPQQYTTLTPYLTLPHLLSLTWLAYPILSLLFVAFRLQLSGASAADAAANAKDDLLTSCLAAERAATATASMPRYLAVATNDQIADAVNGTMNAARATLVLALTIMEAIINFIIDIYRSTFLCFLELVVRGTLSVLIGAVKEFNDFLSSTFNSLRTGIQNDIAKANSVIQSAVDALNKINPFGDITVPQFDIPSLNGLQNVTLPSDFEAALTKLNSSLPTLDQLREKVESIVDTPFELVKKDINDTFAGITFDRSTLPVPAINTVTFCNDMDTSVVDNLGRDLVKITKIGTIILIAAALLLIAANCLLEWYKWRCLKNHLRYTREAWTTDPTLFYNGSKTAPTVELSDHNLLMLQAASQHPLLTRIANRMTAMLRFSPSQHIHLQWFFHYILHPPALACFLIGFFGLLSVQIQLLAVSPLAHHYSQQAAASVNDFSNTIATAINASMYNQSAAYAADVNGRVDHVQSTINDGIFGWVNGTTSTLNTTINDFYTELQDTVNSVFNGTILQSPVDEFIRCFIGSKVDAIENALTFLHDNLHVNIPRVNDTVLVLSPENVNEATRPIATAAIGGQNGEGQESEGLVGRLVGAYVNALKKERIVFGIFMGLWGLVVLMGLAVVFWHSYGRDWVEAYKKRKWQKEQRGGINGIVVPFRDREPGSYGHFDLTSRGTGNHGVVDEKASKDLPSFSPMSSPKPGFFTVLRSPTFRAPTNRHPLNERNPAFEKSWDSVLDHANANTSHPSSGPEAKRGMKISAPMKLMAIGRGRSGTEQFVEDSAKEEESTSTWLRRATSLWKKNPDGAAPSRHRPNLTISVSRASNDLPVVIDGEPANEVAPGSAWSVSPGPAPKVPWMQGLRPKSRRTASVPDSVKSVRDSYKLPMPAQPDLRFAVPLHHGFERAVPTTEPPPALPPMISPVFGDMTMPQPQFPLPPSKSPRHLAPPPVHPHRQPRYVIANPDNASAPVTTTTRTTATNHARGSSQAVDPFATPFDDDHRAPSSPQRQSTHTTNTNPFIAMAI